MAITTFEPDVAVLDFNLGGETSENIADRLLGPAHSVRLFHRIRRQCDDTGAVSACAGGAEACQRHDIGVADRAGTGCIRGVVRMVLTTKGLFFIGKRALVSFA